MSATTPTTVKTDIRLLLTLLRRCAFLVLLVDGVAHAAEEHVVPALFRPIDFLAGSRVQTVCGRVIEPGYRFDRATRRDLDGLCELVLKLPVEVVPGHAKKNFFAPIRI